MTLVELMVSMVISLLILGATLAVIDGIWRNDRRAQLVNDQQASVRVSLERMARQLRNLASPTDITNVLEAQPRSVERNDPNDLIFLDVAGTKPDGSLNSANVRRVRYCVDAATATLWMQTQTWTGPTTPTMPPGTSCPGPAIWNGEMQAVAQNLANGPGRPVFTYSGDGGVITATNDEAHADIERIGANLFLRLNVKNAPPESELMTSVFLRNQNREPLAQFIPTPGAARTIQLNGSASQDPEGRPLKYVWNVDGKDLATPTGILVQIMLAKGPHIIYLKAVDPAGLEGKSNPRQVTCDNSLCTVSPE